MVGWSEETDKVSSHEISDTLNKKNQCFSNVFHNYLLYLTQL